MNTYQRLLSSLLHEFTRKAQPEIRCLWADLMELEETVDESSFARIYRRARRRLFILGRAAGAASAADTQTHTHVLESDLGTLMQTPTATRPEQFARVRERMCEFTEALGSSSPALSDQEPVSEPLDALLEQCTN